MTVWRLACSQARYDDGQRAAADPTADLRRTTFSALERTYSAARRGMAGWSGRIAAKRAVAEVLGLDPASAEILRQIEILPEARRRCTNPLLCRRGHPPVARLGADLRRSLPGAGGVTQLDVSISHDMGVAFAAALAVVDPAPAPIRDRRRETDASVGADRPYLVDLGGRNGRTRRR